MKVFGWSMLWCICPHRADLLNNIIIELSTLLRVRAEVLLEIADPPSFIHSCCDSSPMNASHLCISKPLLFARIFLSSQVRYPHRLPLSCFSLLNWILFAASESTWLTGKHMMAPAGGNEHAGFLSVRQMQTNYRNEHNLFAGKLERNHADTEMSLASSC